MASTKEAILVCVHNSNPYFRYNRGFPYFFASCVNFILLLSQSLPSASLSKLIISQFEEIDTKNFKARENGQRVKFNAQFH